MMNNKLKAKIQARNLVNAEHNRLLPILAEAFEPYIGEKVIKTDGTLLEKFKRFTPVPSSKLLSCYKMQSNYSLGFVIRACVSNGECSIYDEVIVYVGELNGQVLKNLIFSKALPTDFTEQTVLQARETVKKLKEALSQADTQLCGFGEYDN